jgi:hypothetical protein
MVKVRRLGAHFGGLCALWLFSAGWAAAAEPVDLALLVAVDVSDSIDGREARLQRNGYIAALNDPAVLAAIRSGGRRRIALSYVEWAGFGHYKVVVDWRVVGSAADAQAFAAALARVPVESRRRTSISDAIVKSIAQLAKNPHPATRRIIDISGDGPNNYGPLVTIARDRAVAAGITINGLPIRPNPSETETHGAILDIDLYYQDCVVGGPGAFVVLANGFDDFAHAVRRKFILEIAGGAPPQPGLAADPGGGAWDRVRWRLAAATDRPTCNIGEWLWFSTPATPRR